VHDANHIDAVGQKPVEDQVLANRKVAEVLGDVRAGATEVRVIGEKEAPAVQVLKDTVCGVRVVLSDVESDVDQVILSPGGTAHDRHEALPLPNQRASARSNGDGPPP
jgi:hypothetical protein